MRRLVSIAVSLLLVSPITARAQDGARLFAAYTFTHADFSDVHLSAGDHLNGWSAGLDAAIAGPLGVVARVDYGYGPTFKTGPVFFALGTTERSSTWDIVGGPRVSHAFGRLVPFADAQFGVVGAKVRTMGVDALSAATDTAFAAGIGGGIDVHVVPRLDVRAIDVEYLRSTIFDQALNRTSVSFGVAWRFAR